MRKIGNPERKISLVFIKDSVTGKKSMTTWSGNTKRFFVKAEYNKAPEYIPEPFKSQDYPCPELSKFKEVWLLDDNETPPPKKGWCYASGFY